jgi:hypothetical protein
LNKTLAVFIILVIGLYLSIDLFDFRGLNDSVYINPYGAGYLDALKLDRIILFKSDLFRRAKEEKKNIHFSPSGTP